VNLKQRIAKLEAKVPPAAPSTDFDEEEDRWMRYIGTIDKLEGIDDTALAALIPFLLDRWNWYVRAVRDSTARPESKAEERRWPAVLALFFERLPSELRASVAVSKALTDDGPRGNPWLRRWLMEVVGLRSRIPPDISFAVMGELTDLYTHRGEEIDSYFPVCDGCGLRRPAHRHPPLSEWKLLPGRTPLVGEPPWYDLPEFFDSCPHCGTKEWMWESRTEERDYPWRALATVELGR